MQIPDFLPERVKDFIEFLKTKKPVAIVTLILIYLTLCAVFSLLIYSCINKKPKAAKESIPVEEVFTPDQTILLPQGPEIPDGYALSRTPHSTWTESETEQWFTKPDKNNIEDLKKANDSMITDIIGAAP